MIEGIFITICIVITVLYVFGGVPGKHKNPENMNK